MLSFKTVPDIALSIAKRAQEARLSQNLSRKTLSKMSGVAESSIKRFEMSGEISIISLLKIAKALGHINQFEEKLVCILLRTCCEYRNGCPRTFDERAGYLSPFFSVSHALDQGAKVADH